MASSEIGGWIEEIARRASVSTARAQEVLDAKRVRPSPVLASPRRLLLKRVSFSGQKTGEVGEASFNFDWADLHGGLWALTSEANLKGKSSIIEITRWLLRGRSDRVQPDVRAWLHECRVTFELDDIAHEVRVQGNRSVSGSLVRASGGAGPVQLAEFGSEEEFEHVMSDFFLRELGLGAINRWLTGDEEAGQTVVHGWAALSGVLFIGTDYSVLLGDVSPSAGISAPLMQMYLGLPWVSTLAAAKAEQASLVRAQESQARRLAGTQSSRIARASALARVLEQKERELAGTPSDEQLRLEIAAVQRELAQASGMARELEVRVGRERAEESLAEAAVAADRRALLDHIDSVAAGAVFRQLDPSSCPRCETEISEERRKLEKQTHACSVCGEQVVSDQDAAAIKHALEARVKASRAALEMVQKSRVSTDAELLALRTTLDGLHARHGGLTNRLETFGGRRALELEIAVLRGRMQEVEQPEPEPNAVPDDIRAIVDAAVESTEKRVRALQADLLKDVSGELTSYARRFGMVNLESAELKGNGHLPLVKGGAKTSYSKCTGGEKLRLKVATVLAIIRVGEMRGVGRHPGFLMIDSPAAHEVARDDLEQLIAGLKEASNEFKHLQIFIAALSSEAITRNVGTARMRIARGEEPLW